jgi:hypothetical protein
MKAIVYGRYGSPDVLELRDIDRPAVTDDGVLVGCRGQVLQSHIADLASGADQPCGAASMRSVRAS